MVSIKFKTMVRYKDSSQCMEYAVSVWKPRLRRGIDALERVQKRVLRIPHELRALRGYKERFRVVGLTLLEERRDRGDLIQAYKLIKGL